MEVGINLILGRRGHQPFFSEN